MDEVVVLVVLNVTMGSISGQMTICIPGDILETVFRRFEQGLISANRKKENQKPEEKEELLRGVEASMLEMTAEFGEAYISLKDVYRMQVGDLINLHIPKNSDVRISVEDKPWFTGKLGVYKDNKAVKITGTVEDE